jgi:cell division protein FtsB
LKSKIVNILVGLLLIILIGSGAYKCFTAKDYTEDLNKLEEQINANEELMKQKQKEYQETSKQEEEEWNNFLENYENDKAKVKENIKKMHIVGIGDSVMLGAINNLYKEFPNGYFDAKVSRTDYKANAILKDLKSKNMLGEPIIINLGTNGDCGDKCKIDIMKTIGDRKVFWVNLNHKKNPHYNKYRKIY